MCSRVLFAQCQTTQNTKTGKGASLFGYTSLYGAVPGGHAEYRRVPQAHFGPIEVSGGIRRRAVRLRLRRPHRLAGRHLRRRAQGRHACRPWPRPDRADGRRIALHRGVTRVIGVDLVSERLALAHASGVEVVDMNDVEDVTAALTDLTDGRDPTR